MKDVHGNKIKIKSNNKNAGFSLHFCCLYAIEDRKLIA